MRLLRKWRTGSEISQDVGERSRFWFHARELLTLLVTSGGLPEFAVIGNW
jgi:hypothetical protein